MIKIIRVSLEIKSSYTHSVTPKQYLSFDFE